MKLADYLKRNGLTNAAFGERIGMTREAVRRYCVDGMPSRAVMAKIHAATDGAVGPNDFYAIGGKPNAAKKRRSNRRDC